MKYREMLSAKLHRLTVTDLSVNYEGSITIDTALLEAAGIKPYEKVLIADLNNGNRFETYAIKGPANTGTVIVNGAAALLVKKGHKIIVLAFCSIAEEQLVDYKPTAIYVDEKNNIKEVRK